MSDTPKIYPRYVPALVCEEFRPWMEYTVSQAAAVLGASPPSVIDLCERGLIDSRWVVVDGQRVRYLMQHLVERFMYNGPNRLFTLPEVIALIRHDFNVNGESELEGSLRTFRRPTWHYYDHIGYVEWFEDVTYPEGTIRNVEYWQYAPGGKDGDPYVPTSHDREAADWFYHDRH